MSGTRLTVDVRGLGADLEEEEEQEEMWRHFLGASLAAAHLRARPEDASVGCSRDRRSSCRHWS
jgi:hypothetical protein